MSVLLDLSLVAARTIHARLAPAVTRLLPLFRAALATACQRRPSPRLQVHCRATLLAVCPLPLRLRPPVNR